MTILITGVHGFVGNNLVDMLSKNHKIYGLDIVFPHKEGVVKTFSWNDLDNNNLPDVDTIIHLAGKAHDTKSKTKENIYFEINTELTKKVYNYFANSSAKKFIFFSTVKAAADKVDGEYLTEDIVPKPVGAYGESKIAAEDYILANMAKDKTTYIFRPCMIHGPGNKGNLNLLYNVVKKGVPYPLGAFDNRRTFASIDNIGYTVSSFLSNNIESGIYHIADDEALSTKELIEIICQTLGTEARIWKIPKNFMYFLAKIGSRLHLPLNEDRLQKLTENYVASNKKVKDAMRITNFPTSARDGLIKSFMSFKK